MQKNSPHFIGLGTAYAGIGAVAKLLASHPEIPDSIPSLNFFNTDVYDRKGVAWYDANFQTLNNRKLTGEFSVGYLSGPAVAEKIFQFNPETKLFALIRHPLDRAIAQYAHVKQFKSGQRYRNCSEYLTAVPMAQSIGLYGQHLRNYFGYFSYLQLQVIVYEDLLREPLKVIQELYNFLEIDNNYLPRALATFAPKPAEPRHRGLVANGLHFPIKLARQVMKKKSPQIFQPPFKINDYFSEAELIPFKKLYAEDASRLTPLVHRNLVAEWDL